MDRLTARLGNVLSRSRTTDRAATHDRVQSAFARADAGLEYYDGVAVGADTIGVQALAPETLDGVLATLERLEEDDYTRYVRDFVAAGRRLAGNTWRYADILTALAATAALLRPRSYLEIGVRRGRSVAVVGAGAPECTLVGIDLWQPDYAGMENPGPELVRREVAVAGHRGELELLTGDSHEVLPRLFEERPELAFDLVTVDGDHSPRGAQQDLEDVLPRLRIGGALVFDDLRHPAHPELDAVWRRTVEAQRRLSTWRFDDIGYGVGVAVRRW